MENVTTSYSTLTSTVKITDQQTNFATIPAPADFPMDWKIDPQVAFFVAVSAGGLILMLLISNIVLTCKLISLKRQCQARRHTRSNVDLVSGTGYWGAERMEGGIVGPCETNLLLEEVRNETEDEVEAEEEREEEEETEPGRAEEDAYYQSATTTATNMDMENIQVGMQVSASRDSCIDIKELEDMPLVV